MSQRRNRSIVWRWLDRSQDDDSIWIQRHERNSDVCLVTSLLRESSLNSTINRIAMTQSENNDTKETAMLAKWHTHSDVCLMTHSQRQRQWRSLSNNLTSHHFFENNTFISMIFIEITRTTRLEWKWSRWQQMFNISFKVNRIQNTRAQTNYLRSRLIVTLKSSFSSFVCQQRHSLTHRIKHLTLYFTRWASIIINSNYHDEINENIIQDVNLCSKDHFSLHTL